MLLVLAPRAVPVGGRAGSGRELAIVLVVIPILVLVVHAVDETITRDRRHVRDGVGPAFVRQSNPFHARRRPSVPTHDVHAAGRRRSVRCLGRLCHAKKQDRLFFPTTSSTRMVCGARHGSVGSADADGTPAAALSVAAGAELATARLRSPDGMAVGGGATDAAPSLCGARPRHATAPNNSAAAEMRRACLTIHRSKRRFTPPYSTSKGRAGGTKMSRRRSRAVIADALRLQKARAHAPGAVESRWFPTRESVLRARHGAALRS